MSYLPVIALLKRYLGIEDGIDQQEVAEKLRRAVLRLDLRLRTILPALAALLDAPRDDCEWSLLEPGERRRRTFRGVKASEHTAIAATMYRDMDMRGWLQQAKDELGERS